MSRILALVEGPTERSIFDRVFAKDLETKNVFLYSRVVGKPGHKGRNTFSTVRKELHALLRQEPGSYVTMFFDYYGLKDDWPALNASKGKDPAGILNAISQGIYDSIASDIGTDLVGNRFIPYVQVHELESLLFAGSEHMAHVFEQSKLQRDFEKIVAECGGCEKINDNVNTAPSKRIQKYFPGYKKGRSVNAHAYRIIQRTGIDRIRQKCPNFNEWYTKLEKTG